MAKKEERETVTCPYCKKLLDVDGLSGFGLRCSDCGGGIDVFSDETIMLHTESGRIAIEIPSGNGESFPKASLLKGGPKVSLGAEELPEGNKYDNKGGRSWN
jgi:hypothetical protein